MPRISPLILLISLILLNLLNPLSARAQTGACSKLGVNSAAHFAQGDEFYRKTSSYGFGWTLEIADYAEVVNQGNATVLGINRALALGLTPVVRIGVGSDSGGFIDPAKYALFLNKVADQVSGTFYAVAGPNEPEFEHWLAQEKGDDYTTGEPNNPNTAGIAAAGKYLADYMNALLDANLDPKIKLLSPSFSLTSWASDYLIDATSQAGGRFTELDGFSGTSYSGALGTGDIAIHIAKVTSRFPGLPIVLTEVHDGDGNQDLATVKAVFDLVRSDPNILGATIFNAFNTNSGWSTFALDADQLAQILPAECVANAQKVTTIRPTPRPTLRPCTTEDKPEFHPLRPYPGEPCDPLIPRSQPPANDPLNIPLAKEAFLTQLSKDYQLRNSVAFACGKSLTPNTPEIFDTALGRPPDLGGRGYCQQSGNRVTCYVKEKFDLTLDMRDANIPILGNTQIRGLTDAQKMTEYLSWYLNGTVQQSEQEPNPSIRRLVNFSGPLQKLLPLDLKNWIRSALVSGPAGEKFQPPASGGQYHNYIVGCQQDVNIGYFKNVFKQSVKAALASLKAAVLNLIAPPLLIGDTIADLLTTAPSVYAEVSQLMQASTPDIAQIASILEAVGQSNLARDIVIIGGANVDAIKQIGQYMNTLARDTAVSCKDSDAYIRLKNFSDHLPPDPADYDNFKKYWDDYIWWTGRVNLPIIGPVDVPNVNIPFTDIGIGANIWAQLFQNIPFSSLEDTTGEVVISVSADTVRANQQGQDVLPTHDLQPLQLRIKRQP